MRIFSILAIIFFAYPLTIYAVVVGSDTVVSRASRTTFPSIDTNNTILGFAAMYNGFKFADENVTCTYDNFFPVSGIVNFRGGQLYLKQDIYFNSNAILIRGGRIQGNSYNFQFYPRETTFELPSSPMESSWLGDIIVLDTETVVNQVNAVDWSYGNTYVVSASNAGTGNLRLFVMDGEQLTPTTNGSVTLGSNALDIRWHPSQYYVAIARAYSSIYPELSLYYRNISNGTFTQVDSLNYGSQASAIAWHPSGNYLAVATNILNQEIIIYSFSGSTLSLLTSVNLSRFCTFNPGTICWSPDGNYLTFGINVQSRVDELYLYYFNGITLTSTLSSIDLGQNVQAVDWSPTGSYIAVGLDGSTERLRVYKHLAYNGTFQEVISAHVGLTVTAKSLHWATDGSALLVGTNSGSTSAASLYSFDTTTESLVLFDSDTTAASPVNGIRYARDGALYFVEGKSNNSVVLNGFEGSSVRVPFYFNNTSIIFSSDVIVKASCFFEGDCKITTNDTALTFADNGAFILRPGAKLEVNRAHLDHINTENFRCMSDDGSFAFRGCSLHFDRDYTFSHGAMEFEGDVFLSSTNKFVYATQGTSIINPHTIVTLDIGFTFSYDPPGPYRNLWYFSDKSSIMFFNGSNFYLTCTGMDLMQGTLLIDNHCTLSSQGRNLAEGLYFSPYVNVNFLADAVWDLFGFVRVG